MKFVKFKNVKDTQDGDLFFVVFPNGFLVLCCYSWRGYFRPEVNYNYEDRLEGICDDIEVTDDLLVSKLILEDND